jgi:hypothetical protein
LLSRSNKIITPPAHNVNREGQTNDGQEKAGRATSRISPNAEASPRFSIRNGAIAAGKFKRWLIVVSKGSANAAMRAISHILYLMAGLRERSSLSMTQATPSNRNTCQLQVSSQRITSPDKEII